MEVKIKLKIKDVELELTMEDVKKLKELLDTLGERKIQKEYLPYYPWWYWWYTGTPYKYNDTLITCSDNSITVGELDSISYTLTR